MTAITAAPPRLERGRGARIRLSAPHIIRSEWYKLIHTRSTWILSSLMVAGATAFSALMALMLNWDPEDAFATGAAASANGLRITDMVTTMTTMFALIFAVVLGVMCSSSEYSSGAIRSTLAAAPRRVSLLAAKTASATAMAGLAALATVALSFGTSVLIVSQRGLAVGFDWSEIGRMLLGAVVYVALLTAMATTLGTLLRSTAGGIAGTFGLIWILPMIMQMIPADWAINVAEWLPGFAGSQLYVPEPDSPIGLGWLGGLIILCGWIALTGILAAIRARRSDA